MGLRVYVCVRACVRCWIAYRTAYACLWGVVRVVFAFSSLSSSCFLHHLDPGVLRGWLAGGWGKKRRWRVEGGREGYGRGIVALRFFCFGYGDPYGLCVYSYRDFPTRLPSEISFARSDLRRKAAKIATGAGPNMQRRDIIQFSLPCLHWRSVGNKGIDGEIGLFSTTSTQCSFPPPKRLSRTA